MAVDRRREALEHEVPVLLYDDSGATAGEVAPKTQLWESHHPDIRAHPVRGVHYPGSRLSPPGPLVPGSGGLGRRIEIHIAQACSCAHQGCLPLHHRALPVESHGKDSGERVRLCC